MQTTPTTRYDESLADTFPTIALLPQEQAEAIFSFFQQSPLFRWRDANNDCEDRANAICLLLDKWAVPNGKAWVFSGNFRKKDAGELTNLWNYHVAAALPVNGNGQTVWLVIDPATNAQLVPVESWAKKITQGGTSYHFVKQGTYYIFPAGRVEKDNWFARNRRNFNWTMQGLSGINGASVIGRAQLAFQKYRVKKTEAAFKKMMAQSWQKIVSGEA